jgi:WD40 repeat protein
VLDLSGPEPTERGFVKDTENPVLTPDGKTLLCCEMEGPMVHGLRVWDLSEREPRQGALLKPKEVATHVSPMALSPDGKLLAMPQFHPVRNVLIWRLENAKPRLLHVLETETSSVAFAPDNETLAVAHHDGVSLWNAATRKQLHFWKFAGEVRSASFSPDGRYVITANGNGTVYILRRPAPAMKKE